MAANEKKALPLKMPSDDGRIFSNYFANVIVEESGQRLIKPMRYRVRPHGSREEIPTKFNVFNARIDALETRKTWTPLFMKKHGIIAFTHFYEWVSDPENPNGKPKLISFYPDNHELMWAPVLYDEWISKDGSMQFKSFAIITDGPSPEIERMGHDRCPIFLDKEKIDSWLNPKNVNKKTMYEVLAMREETYFSHRFEN